MAATASKLRGAALDMISVAVNDDAVAVVDAVVAVATGFRLPV